VVLLNRGSNAKAYKGWYKWVHGPVWNNERVPRFYPLVVEDNERKEATPRMVKQKKKKGKMLNNEGQVETRD